MSAKEQLEASPQRYPKVMSADEIEAMPRLEFNTGNFYFSRARGCALFQTGHLLRQGGSQAGPLDPGKLRRGTILYLRDDPTPSRGRRRQGRRDRGATRGQYLPAGRVYLYARSDGRRIFIPMDQWSVEPTRHRRSAGLQQTAARIALRE